MFRWILAVCMTVIALFFQKQSQQCQSPYVTAECNTINCFQCNNYKALVRQSVIWWQPVFKSEMALTLQKKKEETQVNIKRKTYGDPPIPGQTSQSLQAELHMILHYAIFHENWLSSRMCLNTYVSFISNTHAPEQDNDTTEQQVQLYAVKLVL